MQRHRVQNRFMTTQRLVNRRHSGPWLLERRAQRRAIRLRANCADMLATIDSYAATTSHGTARLVAPGQQCAPGAVSRHLPSSAGRHATCPFQPLGRPFSPARPNSLVETVRQPPEGLPITPFPQRRTRRGYGVTLDPARRPIVLVQEPRQYGQRRHPSHLLHCAASADLAHGSSLRRQRCPGRSPPESAALPGVERCGPPKPQPSRSASRFPPGSEHNRAAKFARPSAFRRPGASG